MSREVVKYDADLELKIQKYARLVNGQRNLTQEVDNFATTEVKKAIRHLLFYFAFFKAGFTLVYLNSYSVLPHGLLISLEIGKSKFNFEKWDWEKL